MTTDKNNNSLDEEYVDVKGVLLIIWKKLPIILILTAIVTLVTAWIQMSKPMEYTQSKSYRLNSDLYGFSDDGGYGTATWNSTEVLGLYRILTSASFKDEASGYLNVSDKELGLLSISLANNNTTGNYGVTVSYSTPPELKDNTQKLFSAYTDSLNDLLSNYHRKFILEQVEVARELYKENPNGYLNEYASKILIKKEYKLKMLDRVKILELESSSNSSSKDDKLLLFIVILSGVAGLLLSIALVLVFSFIGIFKRESSK